MRQTGKDTIWFFLLRRPCFFLVFVLGGLGCWAQQPHLRFERITMDQGLSQNYIQSLAQDQNGFLWIGTQDGVNRFDGYAFKPYKSTPGEPNVLPHNLVTSIGVTSDNQVWIGTYSGLALYDRRLDVFVPYTKGVPWSGAEGEPINAMAADDQAGLWMGTVNYGLVYGNDKGFVAYPLPDMARTSTEISRVVLSPEGVYANDRLDRLWFFDFQSKAFSLVAYRANQPASQFRALAWKDGRLWGIMEGQLVSFDPQTKELSYFKALVPDIEAGNDVTMAVFDHWNRIWLGGSNGVYVCDAKEKTVYHYMSTEEPHSLTGNRIVTLFSDASDTLWVGTLNGLNRLSLDQPFKTYTAELGQKNTLVGRFVFGMLEDSRGHIWVATVDGVSRLPAGSSHYQNYRHEDEHGLGHRWVRCVAEDASGRVWFGLERGGLNRWDPETDTFLSYQSENAPKVSVMSIMAQADGQLLLATLRGLVTFDPETGAYSRSASIEGGSRGENCFALTQDQQGRIWAGFMRGLFLREEEGQLHQHLSGVEAGSVMAKTVLALLPVDQGVLWVGTTEGLIRYQPDLKDARVYAEADGLANSMIYAILEDGRKRIWVSTNRGLSVLDPVAGSIQNFKVSQGLQNEEFNAGAAVKLRSGEMLFGGVNGYNRFDPELVDTLHGHPPNVVFTELLILDKVIRPSGVEGSALPMALNEMDQLVIAPDVRLFSVEFSATHYAQSKEVQYAWILDGLAEEWLLTDARRRVATFTSLPARPYVLRVKAGINGDWGPERSLRIRVAPPVWRSPLAFVCYVVLGLAVLVSGIRLHSSKLRREQARMVAFNQALEVQVQERTAQLESARQDLLEEAHLAGMAEIASNVLHSVGNTLNSVQASAYLLTQQYSNWKAASFFNQLADLMTKEQWEQVCMDAQRREQFRDALIRVQKRLQQEQELATQEGQRLLERLGEALSILQAQQTHVIPREQYLSLLQLDAFVPVSLEKLGHLLQSVDLEVVCEEVPPVSLDGTQMHRVLFYLLKNALEAIEEGLPSRGSIQIKVAAQQGKVVLTVKDNGCGLPEASTRLYEMGYSTKAQGRGFGLHYCANAVHEMGGEIELHSEGPGKGCMVTLRFPWSSEQVSEKKDTLT